MRKATSRIGQAKDIITEAEGRRQNVTYTGSGYYMWYGAQYSMYRDLNVASHMVYGDNDEVYFYNMLPNLYPPNMENYFVPYYVKGTKHDDEIVIDLPQTIYYNDDWGEGLDLMIFKWEKQPYEGQMTEYWWPQEDIDSVTVHIEKDGSMWFDIPEDCMLGAGFTTDHFYGKFGAFDLSLVNFYEEPVMVPADYGVVEDYWWYNNGIYGYPVAWAPGENEWYLRGLCELMPDCWIKGTTSPDDPFTIKIAQDQYTGIYDLHHFWTKAILLEFDDETGEPIAAELMPEDYEYELIWDPAANTVRAKDPNVYLAINGAKDRVWYLDVFLNFDLVHPTDFSGTPQDPFGMQYFIHMSDFGFNNLQINLPAVSTEGKLLNTNDLYYMVYLDDEPWTFEPDEYGTQSPIEEIPWSLNLPNIGIPAGMPVMREVYIFVDGVSKVGVQSVYRYNGVETRSNIISKDLVNHGTDVDVVDADSKVSDVKYFNLSGVEVTKPAGGIFVKRVTYDDGTVKTFKAAVR